MTVHYCHAAVRNVLCERVQREKRGRVVSKKEEQKRVAGCAFTFFDHQCQLVEPEHNLGVCVKFVKVQNYHQGYFQQTQVSRHCIDVESFSVKPNYSTVTTTTLTRTPVGGQPHFLGGGVPLLALLSPGKAQGKGPRTGSSTSVVYDKSLHSEDFVLVFQVKLLM